MIKSLKNLEISAANSEQSVSTGEVVTEIEKQKFTTGASFFGKQG